MCAFLELPPVLLRPGEAVAVISRLLDFLEGPPPPLPPPLSEEPPPVSPLIVGDLNAAATVSTNWSDFVLINPELLAFSINL
uniref:Uncharacterized protein n=1 Tax=Rhizophora mucronata TaxID=61149 RepID=A0A2P2KVH2_RHIMU